MSLFKNKKVIAWGGSLTFSACMQKQWIDVSYIVDNNQKKWGDTYEGIRILDPENLKNENQNEVFVIVFAMQYEEVRLQLENYGFTWGTNADCFLFLDDFKNMDTLINKEKDYVFLDKLIQPGYICLDVGANYGIFSKKMSLLVGATGQVHSFEPQPNAFLGIERLKNDYDLKNIKSYNVALTNDPNVSSVEMVTPTLDGVLRSGMTTVVSGLSSESLKVEEDSVVNQLTGGATINFDLSTSISVPAITLDAWANNNINQKINFIKIDVEGYELDVLQGAKSLLIEHRPVMQIEIVFSYQHANPLIKILEFLAPYGYDCNVVNNGKLSKIEPGGEVKSEHNFYFIPS
jgi:FkbM family methyltransferase